MRASLLSSTMRTVAIHLLRPEPETAPGGSAPRERSRYDYGRLPDFATRSRPPEAARFVDATRYPCDRMGTSQSRTNGFGERPLRGGRMASRT